MGHILLVDDFLILNGTYYPSESADLVLMDTGLTILEYTGYYDNSGYKVFDIRIPDFDKTYGMFFEVWGSGSPGETLTAGSGTGGNGGDGGDYMKTNYTGGTWTGVDNPDETYTEFSLSLADGWSTTEIGTTYIKGKGQPTEYLAITNNDHTTNIGQIRLSTIELENYGGLGGTPLESPGNFWYSAAGGGSGGPDGPGGNGGNGGTGSAPNYDGVGGVGTFGLGGNGIGMVEYSTGHDGRAGSVGCGGGGAVKGNTTGRLGGYNGPGRIRITYKK